MNSNIEIEDFSSFIYDPNGRLLSTEEFLEKLENMQFEDDSPPVSPFVPNVATTTNPQQALSIPTPQIAVQPKPKAEATEPILDDVMIIEEQGHVDAQPQFQPQVKVGPETEPAPIVMKEPEPAPVAIKEPEPEPILDDIMVIEKQGQDQDQIQAEAKASPEPEPESEPNQAGLVSILVEEKAKPRPKRNLRVSFVAPRFPEKTEHISRVSRIQKRGPTSDGNKRKRNKPTKKAKAEEQDQVQVQEQLQEPVSAPETPVPCCELSPEDKAEFASQVESTKNDDADENVEVALYAIDKKICDKIGDSTFDYLSKYGITHVIKDCPDANCFVIESATSIPLRVIWPFPHRAVNVKNGVVDDHPLVEIGKKYQSLLSMPPSKLDVAKENSAFLVVYFAEGTSRTLYKDLEDAVLTDVSPAGLRQTSNFGGFKVAIVSEKTKYSNAERINVVVCSPTQYLSGLLVNGHKVTAQNPVDLMTAYCFCRKENGAAIHFVSEDFIKELICRANKFTDTTEDRRVAAQVPEYKDFKVPLSRIDEKFLPTGLKAFKFSRDVANGDERLIMAMVLSHFGNAIINTPKHNPIFCKWGIPHNPLVAFSADKQFRWIINDAGIINGRDHKKWLGSHFPSYYIKYD